MITPAQTGYEGQWVNSPDLRTFDLLAQKQTLAVQTAKRSKYSRLLSLHVGSMFSCDRGFKTVKCAFYHTSKRSCNLTQPMSLLKTRKKKKSLLGHQNLGANAIRVRAGTGREEKASLTLIRLQSTKDQWAGRRSGPTDVLQKRRAGTRWSWVEPRTHA